ncbi:MAG TPA: HAMP domain-containing sensor histidine kinase [Bdellovibrionales bacterium]|nr:HAMP domain-containing sensor histidine kinase [Bdellovibrionales bacterium]
MRKPRRHSLYFKLFLIYGLTFLAVAAAVGFGFRSQWAEGLHDRVLTNLIAYSEYLAADIGTPPSLERAAALRERTQIEIVVRGPGVEWATRPELLGDLQSGRVHVVAPGQRPRGWFKKPVALRVARGEFELYFVAPPMREHWSNDYNFILTIVLAGLILFLSYVAIRRVFRPIQWMKEGALAFGDGQWDRRIPVCRDDDLGELARTMNSMAERIGGQFKAMRELLIAISHELRSPLTRMQVALEFVSDQKIRQSLKDDILLLDRMTESLLEKERLERRPDALELRDENLGELLREVAKPYVSRGPGLTVKVPATPVMARIDRSRFSLAIRNLLENAAKFSAEANAPVELVLESAGGPLLIRVRDHGPGIPQDLLLRLGEPFLKADPSRTGSRANGGFGFGLSLSYAILKAHGWNIDVNSGSGGTEFVLSASRP